MWCSCADWYNFRKKGCNMAKKPEFEDWNLLNHTCPFPVRPYMELLQNLYHILDRSHGFLACIYTTIRPFDDDTIFSSVNWMRN